MSKILPFFLLSALVGVCSSETASEWVEHGKSFADGLKDVAEVGLDILASNKQITEFAANIAKAVIPGASFVLGVFQIGLSIYESQTATESPVEAALKEIQSAIKALNDRLTTAMNDLTNTITQLAHEESFRDFLTTYDGNVRVPLEELSDAYINDLQNRTTHSSFADFCIKQEITSYAAIRVQFIENCPLTKSSSDDSKTSLRCILSALIKMSGKDLTTSEKYLLMFYQELAKFQLYTSMCDSIRYKSDPAKAQSIIDLNAESMTKVLLHIRTYMNYNADQMWPDVITKRVKSYLDTTMKDEKIPSDMYTEHAYQIHKLCLQQTGNHYKYKVIVWEKSSMEMITANNASVIQMHWKDNATIIITRYNDTDNDRAMRASAWFRDDIVDVMPLFKHDNPIQDHVDIRTIYYSVGPFCRAHREITTTVTGGYTRFVLLGVANSRFSALFGQPIVSKHMYSTVVFVKMYGFGPYTSNICIDDDDNYHIRQFYMLVDSKCTGKKYEANEYGNGFGIVYFLL